MKSLNAFLNVLLVLLINTSSCRLVSLLYNMRFSWSRYKGQNFNATNEKMRLRFLQEMYHCLNSINT